MRRRWILATILGACLACAPQHQLTDTSSTVMALAAANPRVSTFISMLQASGVAALLKGSDAVTVLAPSNVALDQLGTERVRVLMSPEGETQLAEFVNAYVFPGSYSAEDVARGKLPRSLAGKKIVGMKASDGTPRVEGTGRILESMKGSNGFVHVIDTLTK